VNLLSRRNSLHVLLIAAFVFSAGGKSHAASEDDYWDPSLGQPGPDGSIWSMARQGTDLYVVGSFNQIGGVFATNIARWDGTNWSALGSGLSGGVLAEIHAIVFIGGQLYAGGFFTQAGDVASQGIARWDGTNWSSLAGGVAGGVRALAVSGGNLIAGGSFSAAGGVGTFNIASWNGSNWSALGGGIPGTAVDSLCATGTTIYAGGRFRIGGGINATNVARWNGVSWSGLGEGLRTSNQDASGGLVRSLLATEQGLFAAGQAIRLAGISNAVNIARWDGSNWWALGSGIDRIGEVFALALNGPDLYVGGFFSAAGGLSAYGIARWDGNSWTALGNGLAYPPGPGAVTSVIAAGNELIVGGAFTAAGGKPANNIATWHIPHALSVTRTPESVTLSWPATGTNFVLEAKESLAHTNWTMLSTQHAVAGGQCRVTNKIDSPTRFFRLRRR
jgi:hypothetical protein